MRFCNHSRNDLANEFAKLAIGGSSASATNPSQSTSATTPSAKPPSIPQPTTQAEPTESITTSSSSSTGSGGGSSDASAQSSGTGSSCATKARQFIAPYDQLPTKLPAGLTALPTKPPSGKLIIQVAGPIPSDQQTFVQMQAATKVIGWTAKKVDYDGTVPDLNAKLDLAQAEAVADLIDSASVNAARAAIRTRVSPSGFPSPRVRASG